MAEGPFTLLRHFADIPNRTMDVGYVNTTALQEEVHCLKLYCNLLTIEV
jgi:hypothetical protein